MDFWSHDSTPALIFITVLEGFVSQDHLSGTRDKSRQLKPVPKLREISKAPIPREDPEPMRPPSEKRSSHAISVQSFLFGFIKISTLE
ncbi:uncharacterized protein L3040_006893 [Drepanopeziza brunnea f. sp. 'multigermtubi']|uniref:uncharacterized protein n=1 Tax=Drepanopeziza brunnea f. sp. 'multigermtubi' TaxID=698441 RepID=UPI00238F1482|nr:hypothetical protein L3040_006893 [Drepanopeziza brunnea f. sp. 'multigermtubi']